MHGGNDPVVKDEPHLGAFKATLVISVLVEMKVLETGVDDEEAVDVNVVRPHFREVNAQVVKTMVRQAVINVGSSESRVGHVPTSIMAVDVVVEGVNVVPIVFPVAVVLERRGSKDEATIEDVFLDGVVDC